MSSSNLPNQELVKGLREVYKLSRVTICGDLEWYEDLKAWFLPCELEIDHIENSLIPLRTKWYVYIDNIYPLGKIKFYPDKTDGIKQTFHHQNYNATNKDGYPCRAGDICVITIFQGLGRQGYDIEPLSAIGRLKWFFERALNWLEAAAKNNLIKKGEEFENPDFDTDRTDKKIIFWESKETFELWKSHFGNSGFVDIAEISGMRNKLVIKSFKTKSGKVILAPKWGKHIIRSTPKTTLGLWMLLPEVPVLSPWQAPMTWAELNQVSTQIGLNVKKDIISLCYSLRDKARHHVLLGYPVPRKIGECPNIIFWQPFLLPDLSCKTTATIKGFRKNEQGYQRTDWYNFSGARPILWEKGMNWHPMDFLGRGQYCDNMKNKEILIIGAGAIGSIIAELLVRGGIKNITIIDNDKLEAGNMVRHTLLLNDLDEYKTILLAERLEKASPNANIRGINEPIENYLKQDKAIDFSPDIILDCTGSDKVLLHLEKYTWNEEKLYISVSIGMQAKRLFIFLAKSKTFPYQIFGKAMQEWLEKEKVEMENVELPRDGVGCWHPTFPARFDDICLVASAATKYIERKIDLPVGKSLLTVFEQNNQDALFKGLDLISEVQIDV